jgi:hypothetical protein
MVTSLIGCAIDNQRLIANSSYGLTLVCCLKSSRKDICVHSFSKQKPDRSSILLLFFHLFFFLSLRTKAPAPAESSISWALARPPQRRPPQQCLAKTTPS